MSNKRVQDTLKLYAGKLLTPPLHLDAYNRNIRSDCLTGTITACYGNDNNHFVITQEE